MCCWWLAARSPTSAAVTKLIEGLAPQQPLVHDHIAFRTLGVRSQAPAAAITSLPQRNNKVIRSYTCVQMPTVRHERLA
jgi:hypothetical protein